MLHPAAGPFTLSTVDPYGTIPYILRLEPEQFLGTQPAIKENGRYVPQQE
jgi:hypothetical protein